MIGTAFLKSQALRIVGGASGLYWAIGAELGAAAVLQPECTTSFPEVIPILLEHRALVFRKATLHHHEIFLEPY